MAVFSNSRLVACALNDIETVLADVKNQLIQKGYDVQTEKSSTGGFISLSKGGVFKSILGLRTSLNVDIKEMSGGYLIDAKVGIFGQQVVPSLISGFVAGPVIITQITGLIQQAKLDDEVIDLIEKSMNKFDITKKTDNNTLNQTDRYCVFCGKKVTVNSIFCPNCGTKQ